MNVDLDDLVTIARSAGAILMRHFGAGLAVHRKQDDEPVTDADREANEFLVRELSRRYPGDAILSEEAPDDGLRFHRRRTWMVDPMDGTQDFISGHEGFAVMIGLLEEYRPIVGVVHQPSTGTTYVASRGGGAFCDGAPIRVSPVAELDQARLVSSRARRSKTLAEVREALGITKDLAFGSAGLKVGLVARGERDLYVNAAGRSKRWDVCGPQVILEEAGGRLTDLRGGEIRYDEADVTNRRGLLASNGLLHAVALERLAPLFPHLPG